MKGEVGVCFNCNKISRYSCPSCSIRYCSANCYRIHQESCVVLIEDQPVSKEIHKYTLEPFELYHLLSDEVIRKLSQDALFQEHAKKLYEDPDLIENLCNEKDIVQLIERISSIM